MAYISTEKVKEIRTNLKTQFPKVKFSIRREHYSGVRIAILSSNVNFEADYKQINEYYINEHYSGAQANLLSKVYEIASVGTEWRETCDYGSQPSHYVWITVGEWNKPYQVKN
jgi:hypothetical protein